MHIKYHLYIFTTVPNKINSFVIMNKRGHAAKKAFFVHQILELTLIKLRTQWFVINRRRLYYEYI